MAEASISAAQKAWGAFPRVGSRMRPRSGPNAKLRKPLCAMAGLTSPTFRRADRAASSLPVLIGQRRRPMTPLEEHDLRKLVALWSEVKAALEARGATR